MKEKMRCFGRYKDNELCDLCEVIHRLKEALEQGSR